MDYLDNKKTDNFFKIKHKLQKLFPNARVERSRSGKFYMVDENGYRILTEEYNIPDCNTIFDAWKKTLQMCWARVIVMRNNAKFSDEKIMKKIVKKEETFSYKD